MAKQMVSVFYRKLRGGMERWLSPQHLVHCLAHRKCSINISLMKGVPLFRPLPISSCQYLLPCSVASLSCQIPISWFFLSAWPTDTLVLYLVTGPNCYNWIHIVFDCADVIQVLMALCGAPETFLPTFTVWKMRGRPKMTLIRVTFLWAFFHDLLQEFIEVLSSIP